MIVKIKRSFKPFCMQNILKDRLRDVADLFVLYPYLFFFLVYIKCPVQVYVCQIKERLRDVSKLCLSELYLISTLVHIKVDHSAIFVTPNIIFCAVPDGQFCSREAIVSFHILCQAVHSLGFCISSGVKPNCVIFWNFHFDSIQLFYLVAL